MAGKTLFICGTPLQSLIIKRIIELECLDKSDCILFFYTYDKNDKHNYYFDELSKYFGSSYYYLSDNRYPKYVVESRGIFSKLDFQTVYFASVSSSFVLMALSQGKHEKIYTFDDGTANIMPGSSYARKYGLSVKKFLGLGLFGNRYSVQRIRNETLAHYTIYPGFENNISDKLIPITIFPALRSGGEITKCSVILGTVFREALAVGEVDKLVSSLSRFCKSIDGDVYYLPHPRAMDARIEGCTVIESKKIAEEVIEELYEEYAEIDLYGFSSSTQINLSYLKDLNNYLLSSSAIKHSAQEMLDLAGNAGMSLGLIIDLDLYGN